MKLVCHTHRHRRRNSGDLHIPSQSSSRTYPIAKHANITVRKTHYSTLQLIIVGKDTHQKLKFLYSLRSLRIRSGFPVSDNKDLWLRFWGETSEGSWSTEPVKQEEDKEDMFYEFDFDFAFGIWYLQWYKGKGNCFLISEYVGLCDSYYLMKGQWVSEWGRAERWCHAKVLLVCTSIFCFSDRPKTRYTYFCMDKSQVSSLNQPLTHFPMHESSCTPGWLRLETKHASTCG